MVLVVAKYPKTPKGRALREVLGVFGYFATTSTNQSHKIALCDQRVVPEATVPEKHSDRANRISNPSLFSENSNPYEIDKTGIWAILAFLENTPQKHPHFPTKCTYLGRKPPDGCFSVCALSKCILSKKGNFFRVFAKNASIGQVGRPPPPR